jgi:hypothetical protein
MSASAGGGCGPTPARSTGPWAAAPPGAARRSIFPVPLLPRAGADAGRRGYPRPSRVTDDINAGLSGLNWLNGGATTREEDAGESEPIHEEIRARVDGHVRYWHRLRPRAPPPREVFKQLLLDRSGYDLDTAGVAPAPFDLDRLAMPEDDVSETPFFTALFSPADREMVEVGAQPFLRSHEERDAALLNAPREPYTDPKLKSHRRLYARFVQRLKGKGFLRFTWDPLELIGIFCVLKKDK